MTELVPTRTVPDVVKTKDKFYLIFKNKSYKLVTILILMKRRLEFIQKLGRRDEDSLKPYWITIQIYPKKHKKTTPGINPEQPDNPTNDVVKTKRPYANFVQHRFHYPQPTRKAPCTMLGLKSSIDDQYLYKNQKYDTWAKELMMIALD